MPTKVSPRDFAVNTSKRLAAAMNDQQTDEKELERLKTLENHSDLLTRLNARLAIAELINKMRRREDEAQKEDLS